MCRGQAGGYLPADIEHVDQLQWPVRVDLLLQSLSGDVIHHDIGDRPVLDGVDGDHILVADGRGRSRFAHEPLASRSSRGEERRHELDRDVPMQLLVKRLDHGPEAAVPKNLQHVVMRQPAQRARLL